MVLIRMVNHIPLLDSAEGVACGLVQGIIAKESLWQAFGLEVSLRATTASLARVPTYAVKDSSQVLPFLKSQHTGILDDDQLDDDSRVESDDESFSEKDLEGEKRQRKRCRRRPQKVFLPADSRLGHILLIVQIHAEPSQLPLPTLCKGRIPQDNTAINQALEVSLKASLRQLQMSNPALFLTTRELRVVERKVCFVPLLSNAVTSILGRSRSVVAREAIDKVKSWDDHKQDKKNRNAEEDAYSQTSLLKVQNIEELAPQFCRQLLSILDRPKPATRRQIALHQDEPNEDSQSVSSSEDEDLLLQHYSMLAWAKDRGEEDSKVHEKQDDEDTYDELA